MEVVENITRTTLQEIEKVLTTRTIVGEPMIVDGKTIIPLISIAFGFGAGGAAGKGEGPRKGEGEGGGTGGGAIIRPVAVIISDKETIKIEPVVGGIAGAMEKVGESLPRIIEKVIDQIAKRRESN